MEHRLEPGSVVVAYSDGVIEAQDPAGEVFGEDRLLAILGECGGKSASAVMNEVVCAVERFTEGSNPYDDLTLVVARWVG